MVLHPYHILIDSNELEPNYFVSSHDNTTQPISGTNAWQNINFSDNIFISGWTHTSGTSSFICGSDNYYKIYYSCVVQKTAGSNTAHEIACFIDNIQIAGSQLCVEHKDNSVTKLIERMFCANISSGSTVVLKQNSDSGTSQIVSTKNIADEGISATIFIEPIL